MKIILLNSFFITLSDFLQICIVFLKYLFKTTHVFRIILIFWLADYILSKPQLILFSIFPHQYHNSSFLDISKYTKINPVWSKWIYQKDIFIHVKDILYRRFSVFIVIFGILFALCVLIRMALSRFINLVQLSVMHLPMTTNVLLVKQIDQRIK